MTWLTKQGLRHIRPQLSWTIEHGLNEDISRKKYLRLVLDYG